MNDARYFALVAFAKRLGWTVNSVTYGPMHAGFLLRAPAGRPTFFQTEREAWLNAIIHLGVSV